MTVSLNVIWLIQNEKPSDNETFDVERRPYDQNDASIEGPALKNCIFTFDRIILSIFNISSNIQKHILRTYIFFFYLKFETLSIQNKMNTNLYLAPEKIIRKLFSRVVDELSTIHLFPAQIVSEWSD